MEDGGVAETGRLSSQMAQKATTGLGTEGNGDANVAAVKKNSGMRKKLAVRRCRGRPQGSSSGSPHFASIVCEGGSPTGGLGGSVSVATVTLYRGEEILDKLSSLIAPDSHLLSVLSAAGAVSSVVVHQPGPSGGIMSYEGYFQILALNGSFTIRDGRICLHPDPELSLVIVTLAMPDGRVFSGGVAGPLIAAGPIQLVVANIKHHPIHEVGQPEQIARMLEVGDNTGTPTSVLLEPTDKEAKTPITSGNVNPASACIDEHNPLEPVEPMLDWNMATDTKTNVPEL